MSQTTMQQVIITEPGGVDKLAYETVTIPEAKADEVLVKVHAFGINRPDILQRQGLYPMPAGVTQVPGLEVAGEVVAIGAEVTQFKLGDKVCGLTNGGGYAEYCVVPQSQTLHIPENVSFVEAAAIPETFFTVWANVFQMGKAKAGEVVLVHGGTSGIGTTALMLCKALSIKTFATVGSDEKVQAIANLTDAINYKTQDFEHEINERTENAGVDLIFIFWKNFRQKKLTLGQLYFLYYRNITKFLPQFYPRAHPYPCTHVLLESDRNQKFDKSLASTHLWPIAVLHDFVNLVQSQPSQPYFVHAWSNL